VLYLAVSNNHPQVVEWLLRNGADVNRRCTVRLAAAQKNTEKHSEHFAGWLQQKACSPPQIECQRY
jgi:hypothetical protein